MKPSEFKITEELTDYITDACSIAGMGGKFEYEESLAWHLYLRVKEDIPLNMPIFIRQGEDEIMIEKGLLEDYTGNYYAVTEKGINILNKHYNNEKILKQIEENKKYKLLQTQNWLDKLTLRLSKLWNYFRTFTIL